MITITVKKEKDLIKQITLKGHAMYDDYGKDIVCAGVSSILTTSVNAIIMFDDKAITYEEKDGEFVLKVNKKDEITSKLILNMLNLFYELEESYSKNIKIREDE